MSSSSAWWWCSLRSQVRGVVRESSARWPLPAPARVTRPLASLRVRAPPRSAGAVAVGRRRSSPPAPRHRSVPGRREPAALRGLAASAFLSGDSTIDMLRPSSRAWVSTLTYVADHVEHLVEDLRAELRVGHLATPELQRDLDLVTFVDELVDLADLDVEVAPADLRAELDLLDRHVRRLAPGLLGLLGLLVPELAVVHDPAHRRVGHRGHLDEVELESSGHLQRLGDRLDPQLIAVRADEADLTGPDAVVDAVLFACVALRRGYGCSLLCNGCCLPVRCRRLLDAKPAERPPTERPGGSRSAVTSCRWTWTHSPPPERGGGQVGVCPRFASNCPS